MGSIDGARWHVINMKQKIFFYSITFLLLSFAVSAQYNTVIGKFYSKNVKDSFEIYTSKPADFSPDKSYDVVYYCDANLKSGKKLRELIDDSKTYANKNCIFIGIGHIGDYHVLRRRDYITPTITKTDTVAESKNYGHIQDFYKCLTNEIIPSAEKNFKSTGERTIIGHSLGGLFVFYCFFINETVFTNYISLSPALWINYYNIYKFNKLTTGLRKPGYLYMSAGSLEVFNYILSGCNTMNDNLKKANYQNLKFEYQVHKGDTHNSQVPHSLKYILPKL